jgi:hypothetical protein
LGSLEDEERIGRVQVFLDATLFGCQRLEGCFETSGLAFH